MTAYNSTTAYNNTTATAGNNSHNRTEDSMKNSIRNMTFANDCEALAAPLDSTTAAALEYAQEFIHDNSLECNAATWQDIVIDIAEGIVPADSKFESITEYIYSQFDEDNSQPTGPIYYNPLQVMQDHDPAAADSLTDEQQHYLDSFLDFESYAFTVDQDSNSVTVWDSISWDVLNTCSLGEFVIDTLREARDAEPAGPLTPEDIQTYADSQGQQAAANLLLLAGPDNYTGDYDATMAALTA